MRSNKCFAAIETVATVPRQIVYTDQTGPFPSISTQGSKLLFVLYKYDSNAIIVEPLKSRAAAEIKRAFEKVHKLLTQRGLRPKFHRLDNEASTLLKDFLKQEQIDYHLVTPGVHRINAAERAIRTFKNHFIAGLCTTDPGFPIGLWDKLLEQAQHSLNLLRQSQLHPQFSAYGHIWGNFDFNRTPFAPPGIKAVAHVKPDKRGTWAPHGLAGWYIGLSMEHYRCYKIHIIKTGGQRDIDTLTFFPHYHPLPTPSPIKQLTMAAKQLTQAIRIQPHTNATTRNSLAQIDQIVQQQCPKVPDAPGPRVPNAHIPSLPNGPVPRVPSIPATTESVPEHQADCWQAFTAAITHP